jgi:pimeloyl-ACP methyl ester carboxylesterase
VSNASEFVTVNANGLEFEVLQAGSGDHLALCLHGWPEHALMWKHHLDTLVDLGYRVWAPNLRGYGNSSKPQRMAAYTAGALTADVTGLIDASGATKVSIVSHDWGSILAWLVAADKLRPLERLVVMNVPHPLIFMRALAGSWRQRLRSWYVFFFQLPWLPEAMIGHNGGQTFVRGLLGTTTNPQAFTEEELAAYARQAADFHTMKAMLNWYRAAIGGGELVRLRDRGFDTIEVPAMLVWGEDDVALGLELSEGNERYVRDLRVERIAGASHFVSQDAAAKVNLLLRDFLGPA